MAWAEQDRKLSKWEFLCFLSGFMHCAVLTAHYKSCSPSLVGDIEKVPFSRGVLLTQSGWWSSVSVLATCCSGEGRGLRGKLGWNRIVVKEEKRQKVFHPSKLHFKTDWQQCCAWKEAWWCLSSLSTLGRQKCPMTSVTAATRDGKPALGSKAGQCLVKEFLHEIWEQINLEAKFRGSLEKTYSAKADIMTCKNACNSAHEDGAVPLTSLMKDFCLCSVSQSLKTGTMIQGYKALANSRLKCSKKLGRNGSVSFF